MKEKDSLVIETKKTTPIRPRMSSCIQNQIVWASKPQSYNQAQSLEDDYTRRSSMKQVNTNSDGGPSLAKSSKTPTHAKQDVQMTWLRSKRTKPTNPLALKIIKWRTPLQAAARPSPAPARDVLVFSEILMVLPAGARPDLPAAARSPPAPARRLPADISVFLLFERLSISAFYFH